MKSPAVPTTAPAATACPSQSPPIRRATTGKMPVVHALHSIAPLHRAGGELPEVGHQPRVRIRAQPGATQLLPVVGELLLAQAPFEEGARINAGRRMRLEVDEVGVAPITIAA